MLVRTPDKGEVEGSIPSSPTLLDLLAARSALGSGGGTGSWAGGLPRGGARSRGVERGLEGGVDRRGGQGPLDDHDGRPGDAGPVVEGAVDDAQAARGQRQRRR